YAEYHGGGGCDPAGVTAYVRGCLGVLAELALIEPAPPAPRPDPLIVEDERHGSGHIQANHPAPSRGGFEPAVPLGHQAGAGDLLGTVTDLLGDRVVEVRAAHAGLVLVLHTFARVETGEGLVVVLETDQSLPTTTTRLPEDAR